MLNEQIQINTAKEYVTSEITPHKKVNLVPISESLIVISRATAE